MAKVIYSNTEVIHMEDDVYFKLKKSKKDVRLELWAIVSQDKWPIISKYKWYLGKDGYPVCYELSKIKLHRFCYFIILGQKPPSKIYIDHINRNKMDNTNKNLRMATAQENSFNRSSNTNTKGVRKISENNYTASITKNGKRHEIKNIATIESAAEMYNMMAEELFGVFAAPNKLD